MTAWNSTLKPSHMKRKGPKRSNTRQEREHLNAVAEQGCVLCQHLGYGKTPAEIHHLRHGMGMAQRNSNYNVIPLCPEHHRGSTGYHGLGRREFERVYGVTELDLLAMSQKNSPATEATAPSFFNFR